MAMILYSYVSYSHWGMIKVIWWKDQEDKSIFDEIDQQWYENEED